MSTLLPFQLDRPVYLRKDLAYQDVEYFAQPALGGQVNYTVKSDAWCLPLALRANFNTSAVVSDRTVMVRINDPDSVFLFEVPAIVVHPASTARTYDWLTSVSVGYGPVGGYVMLPFPALLLPSAYRLRIRADNLDAGDQITNATMVCIKIPTGGREDEREGGLPLSLPLVFGAGGEL